MKKASKVLLILLCAVLLVVGSVMGTLAYLSSQDEAVNYFTVGQVKISLDEAPVNDVGEATTGNRVQTNDYHLLPGHYYSKDPTVHVTKGSEDCYVRMFVTITHDSQWASICDNHKESGQNLFAVEDIFVDLSDAWTLHETHENVAADNCRTYEYWYHTKVTDVSETQDKDLEALFIGIQMPDELTNEDLILLSDDADTDAVDEGFKIHVVAQAIQADGFDDDADAFRSAPTITGADLVPGIVSATP